MEGAKVNESFPLTRRYLLSFHWVYLLKNGQIEGDAEYDENGIVKVTFYREDANVRTRHYAENKKASAVLRHQMASPIPEFCRYPTLH